MRATSARRWPSRHWKIALCSESTGSSGTRRSRAAAVSRRQETGGADDRREDDVGVDLRRERHEALRPRQDVRPRRGQRLRDGVDGGPVRERERTRPVPLAQLRHQRGIRPPRRHALDAKLLGKLLDELEGAAADGSRDAEHRQALHDDTARVHAA
jgi:hypothetical protein